MLTKLAQFPLKIGSKYIAIEVPRENTSNEWLSPVTDEEYNKLH